MTPQQNTAASQPVSEKRLWFGLAGSVVSWSVVFLLDVIFAWQACMGGEAGSGVFTSSGMRILLGCITFGFLALGACSGFMSFHNWQKLSNERDVFHSEARPRKQYMAVIGVIATVIMGIGIMWFSVPIYVLSICMRWR